MTDESQTRDELAKRRKAARRPPRGAGGGRRPPAQAEARVARLLDAVGDIYFTLDRHWRFTHLNRHALRHASRPAEELLGRTLWEAYPELLGTPLEGHYRRAMEGGGAIRFETLGVHSG